MVRYLFRSVLLLVVLNLLVKPLWIFGVDRNVQVFTGYDAYGIYFSYLSFTIIFNIVADAGITLFVQQKVAAQRLAGDWFQKAISYKLLLSGVYVVVVFSIAWLLHLHDVVLLTGLVLLQLLLSWISFARAVLASGQFFTYSSLLSVFDKLLLIVPAIWFFYLSGQPFQLTIYAFTWWQVTAAAIALAVSCILVYQSQQFSADVQTNEQQHSFKQLVSESLPFAAVIFMMFLHARADGVLLNILPGHAEQAGQYAAMYRFVDAATVLSYLAAGFLLSFWARHLKQPDFIRDTVNKMFCIMLAGAALVCVLFFFYSNQLQLWLYKTNNEQAAQILKWGIFVLVPCFLIDIFGTLLTANKKLKPFLVLAAGCAAINIGLNIILIPVYHAAASVFIAILTQSLLAAGLMFVCQKEWKLLPTSSSFYRILGIFALLNFFTFLVNQTALSITVQVVLVLICWLLLLFFLKLFSVQWFVRWQQEN